MKLFVKTEPRTRGIVRHFPAAHFAIVAINFGLGLASVAGAALFIKELGLTGTTLQAAIVIAGVIAMAVAMAPALLAPAWTVAKTHTKFFGLFVVSGFLLLDGGFQTQAVGQFSKLANAQAIATAESDLSEAKADLKAIPLPSATGEIRRKETWETVNNAAVARVETAKVEMAEASQPIVPLIWIMAAALLLQVSSFLARAWLTSITQQLIKKQAEMDAADSPEKGAKTYSEKAVKGQITKAVNAALAAEREKSQGLRVVG
ncbi:MAG: hypothetical protein VXW22_10235 [Pseudomonadota bacterium]|nr:hypothetical protein [Pseudomonadota bacterium]